MYMYYTLDYTALAILSRSPSAFEAVRNLGILQLPCDRTLRGYMHKHCSSPGIDEESIWQSALKYQEHIQEKISGGYKKPLQEGILIWDETKV